jgi:hypothetical protein
VQYAVRHILRAYCAPPCRLMPRASVLSDGNLLIEPPRVDRHYQKGSSSPLSKVWTDRSISVEISVYKFTRALKPLKRVISTKILKCFQSVILGQHLLYVYLHVPCSALLCFHFQEITVGCTERASINTYIQLLEFVTITGVYHNTSIACCSTHIF